MNLINRLERKFGKYAIDNLTMYIIITYVVGYLITFLMPNVLTYLILEPKLILQGQIWRVISWLLIPPGSLNIFTIIMLFFYYSIGKSLEQTWGAFRYNLYIFGGIILTVIGSFVLYGIMSLLGGSGLLILNGGAFSTYYIALSIFLGFAAEYPDMQVLLYFLIPIKIKWLAYLDIILLVWESINSNWVTRAAIICSLMNFIIFFLMTRKSPKRGFYQSRQSYQYRQAGSGTSSQGKNYRKVRPTPNAKAITKHKCAICGRTEKDGDQLEFRFCSKCNGNYEYCQDHLFTHKHVQ